MKIIKRNGRGHTFNPNNILKRIKDQSNDLKVDADSLGIKIISQVADGISSRELDNLIVEGAAMKVINHPDYSTLASRIFVTSLWKDTPQTFSESVKLISLDTDQLCEEFLNYVSQWGVDLDSVIVKDRDFNHDIFGLKTLEKSYLMRDGNGNIVERPQYLWMRTAIEVTGYSVDINEVKRTYDLLSEGYYTHATPTLFNSGGRLSQLSSCFLLSTKDDSIDGLFDTIKDTARISKLAGGLSVSLHNVRAKGSLIKGTNGQSDGIVPMLKTLNETARWINQGGRRKGSFAMYLEPWHRDVFSFLEMKKNHGAEELRARDLFFALWVPDLFMKRVIEDKDWTLFCPNEVLKSSGVKLYEIYGSEFEQEYEKLETLGIGKSVKARELWEKILVSQIETGTPYILYKDRANECSNQKNLGTIRSSNLCAEIIEYTNRDQQAVCNLASISLSKFVDNDGLFDCDLFRKVVRTATRNLDKVIDSNYYPTPETRHSNLKHRPIGLGVQGLADTFAKMGLAFDSDAARGVNRLIFENMYFAALKESMTLAMTEGEYATFKGSPMNDGMFQFDLYGLDKDSDMITSDMLDWEGLRRDIKTYGLRNSLLIALMPTASTSQILGNNECFEPFTSNLSTRRTLAGEYIVINKHLVDDLEKIGLWNSDIIEGLKRDNGSVQNLPIPTELKERYKTAYEISQKAIIDLAADRQRFVCQSQSMNLFLANPDFSSLSSMLFYTWKAGLKTGIYYLRSKPAVNAKKFTVEVDKSKDSLTAKQFRDMVNASKEAAQSDDDDCLMCGS